MMQQEKFFWKKYQENTKIIQFNVKFYQPAYEKETHLKATDKNQCCFKNISLIFIHSLNHAITVTHSLDTTVQYTNFPILHFCAFGYDTHTFDIE